MYYIDQNIGYSLLKNKSAAAYIMAYPSLDDHHYK